MLVKRLEEKNVSSFKLGDILEFTLSGGEKIEAVAIEQHWTNTVFCAKDCLQEMRPMNSFSHNKGGYEESELRKYINSEVLQSFPPEVREKMVPVFKNDYLRIPSLKEVFGELGTYYEGRLPHMADRRNRLAYIEDKATWWWLMDPPPKTITRFCVCTNEGKLHYDFADHSNGVRLVFALAG